MQFERHNSYIRTQKLILMNHIVMDHFIDNSNNLTILLIGYNIIIVDSTSI